MKNLLHLLTAICLLATTHTHAQSWQWARQNTTGYAYTPIFPTRDPVVATDAFGNVYMAGAFDGPITFGAFTVSLSWGVYVVKYDSSGNVLWLKGFRGSNYYQDMEPSSIVTDGVGSVYVTGYTGDTTLTFGTSTLHNSTGGYGLGLFLVKYAADGTPVWARTNGGKGGGGGQALSVDAKGDIYVSGAIQDSVTFGSSSLVSPYNNNGFIAKYDSTGNALWAKKFGGNISTSTSVYNNYLSVNGLATDDSGNTVLTGHFPADTLDFGTATLTLTAPFGHKLLFFAKYDSTGNLLWARTATGDSDCFGQSLITDAAGSIYLLGNSYGSSLTFGTTTIPNPKWFFVKLDNAGNLLWYKKSDYGYYEGPQGPNTLAKDEAGNIYMSGNYYGSFVLGPDTFISGIGNNIIIAKYDTSGTLNWIKKGDGGENSTYTYSLATSNTGAVYVGGFYIGPIATFGHDTLTNSDSTQFYIYLVKLDTTFTLIINQNSAPSQENAFGINLFPNPTNGVFNLNMPPGNSEATIKILNNSGKTVLQRKTSTYQNEFFDLTSYPCGTYWVDVNVGGKRYTGEIILK